MATIKAKAPAGKPYDTTDCYDCHEDVKGFHQTSSHKSVGCDSCHGGLDTHKPKGKGRPTTNMDPANCGTCHQNQFRTLYTMNTEKTAHKEKTVATGTAMDKILTPHGFTREHNEPRSHAFALYDQVVVDRAFGGRFQNKEGKQGLTRMGGNINTCSSRSAHGRPQSICDMSKGMRSTQPVSVSISMPKSGMPLAQPPSSITRPVKRTHTVSACTRWSSTFSNGGCTDQNASRSCSVIGGGGVYGVAGGTGGGCSR